MFKGCNATRPEFQGSQPLVFTSLAAVCSVTGGSVQRIDQTLPHYEAHAEAPDIFPRILHFLRDEILPEYGSSTTILHYELPSWMGNQ